MKDKHTYGKKMARKGRKKVIYKGTFISIQTLVKKRSSCLYFFQFKTTKSFVNVIDGSIKFFFFSDGNRQEVERYHCPIIAFPFSRGKITLLTKRKRIPDIDLYFCHSILKTDYYAI